MAKETNIKLFEEREIEASEEWYFSAADAVEALTGSANPRDYRFKMKQRVKLEDGIELSTICRQLKMRSSDGKKYLHEILFHIKPDYVFLPVFII
jgi:prophage antirepressor-like protein